MPEQSGFFNAVQSAGGTYDRTYNASDFAKYFALFIGTGVFIKPTDQLKVVPKRGLTVTLKAGNAFIDGYWYELDEDMDFTLSPNSASYAVSDVIAITLDKSARTITANKKEAVTSILPVNDGTKHELIVCSISVGAGVSTITESVITDRRSDKNYCGFVTGVVDQIDVGSMFSQLESQFNDWFNEMKGQLSTDAAGNLQLKIDEMKTDLNAVLYEELHAVGVMAYGSNVSLSKGEQKIPVSSFSFNGDSMWKVEDGILKLSKSFNVNKRLALQAHLSNGYGAYSGDMINLRASVKIGDSTISTDSLPTVLYSTVSGASTGYITASTNVLIFDVPRGKLPEITIYAKNSANRGSAKPLLSLWEL